MRKFMLAVAAAILGLALPVWAHAHLVRSNPNPGAVLKAMPAHLTLTFSEPLEMKFSRFYLVRLDVPASATRAQQETAALAMLASAPKEHLESGISPNSGRGTVIAMDTDPHAKAGTYAVIWKALSADGHAVKDCLVFRVAP